MVVVCDQTGRIRAPFSESEKQPHQDKNLF